MTFLSVLLEEEELGLFSMDISIWEANKSRRQKRRSKIYTIDHEMPQRGKKKKVCSYEQVVGHC